MPYRFLKPLQPSPGSSTFLSDRSTSLDIWDRALKGKPVYPVSYLLCIKKSFLTSYFIAQHSWIPVWKTHHLLPVLDVHCGRLQLPAVALLWQRLQGIRRNHHKCCICSPAPPIAQHVTYREEHKY